MSKTLIYAVVAAIVIAAGAWWYLARPASAPSATTEVTPQKIETSEEAGLGGQLLEQAQPNPAASVPETNPFKAKTNPYDGAYQNPFGQ